MYIRAKALLGEGGIASDAFRQRNDPQGEHDFAALTVEGARVMFRIDYYDRELTYGSEDPADPLVTRRVMTVWLAEEG